MRKLFSLLTVSGLSLLAFSGVAHADIFPHLQDNKESIEQGIMPVLFAVLFLLVILAGSLPAFSETLEAGSGFACQSVYDLIDTFKGVKEDFLKVLIGSAFAFGLLGGAYAVLRVVF